MESDKPHIIISYLENIPNDIPQGIIDEVQHPNLKLIKYPMKSERPFATIEWLLPTAIVIFITKAYFDAFLKEMGKDHYALLKKGILSVWNKLLHKDKIINLIAIGSKGKVKSTKYSMAFSVWSELNDQFRLKFLFDEQMTENQFEEYVSLILQFLKTIHMEGGNIKDCLIIEDDIRHAGRIILVAFDKEVNKLRMLSPIPDKKEK